MPPAESAPETGCLYLVATPIGHRDDISERARRVLGAVDVVAAEDTRHSGRLLEHLGVATPLLSLHEHNEQARVPGLIERLRAGASVAVVSDAGTPGVSDPGYRLVVAAHAAGIPVVPVPGPSAVIAALVVSGQPTDRFVFEGFLPARRSARRQRLETLAREPRTLVLFESGRRVVGALEDLAGAFGGERPATLARELTKAHETVRPDTLAGLAAWVAADADQRRGEIVLVVAGADESAAETAGVTLAAALDALVPELPPARAAAVAARLTGVRRRDAYRAALDHPKAGEASD